MGEEQGLGSQSLYACSKMGQKDVHFEPIYLDCFLALQPTKDEISYNKPLIAVGLLYAISSQVTDCFSSPVSSLQTSVRTGFTTEDRPGAGC
jgi:hypothetical protein